MAYVDGVLGLDNGTSATRAAIVKLGRREATERQAPYLVTRRALNRHIERFEPCDHPSGMNCFETNKSPEECIGFLHDDPDSIPIKMWLYVFRTHLLRLRNTPQDIELADRYMRGIPQLKTFFGRFDGLTPAEQGTVVAHGLAIYIAHFQQMRLLSEQQVEDQGIKIAKLSAAFPGNWDNWMQKLFIQLLTHVWDNLGQDSIELVKESECVAYWLIYNTPSMRNHKPKELVSVDFGGHTMCSETYAINYNATDKTEFSIIMLFDDRCVHAGSELHCASVQKKLKKKLEKEFRSRPKKRHLTEDRFAKIYQTMMEDYHLHKHKISDKPFKVYFRPDNGSPETEFSIEFNEQEAAEMYHRCFGGPLEDFSRLLAASTITRSAFVVPTGGSFYNIRATRDLKQAVAEAGLRIPVWLQGVEGESNKSRRVSEGAALALRNPITVPQFMSRATFALQFKTFKESDKGAQLMLVRKDGAELNVVKEIKNRQGSYIELVCHPQGLKANIELTPPFEGWYTFMSGDKLKQGKYQFRLEYDEPSSTIALHVDTLDSNEAPSVQRWPVYYDPGSRICVADLDEAVVAGVSALSRQDVVSPSIRFTRANKKGKQAKIKWIADHNDGGRRFWEEATSESLPDISLFHLRQYAQQDADRLNDFLRGCFSASTAATEAHSVQPGIPDGSANRHNATRETSSRGGVAAQQSSAGESRAQGSVGATRKRRGTSSGKAQVSAKQRSSRNAQVPGSTDCSFAFSTIDLTESDGESTRSNQNAKSAGVVTENQHANGPSNQQVREGEKAANPTARSPLGPAVADQNQGGHPPRKRSSDMALRERSSKAATGRPASATVSATAAANTTAYRAQKEYRLPPAQELVSCNFTAEVHSDLNTLQRQTGAKET